MGSFGVVFRLEARTSPIPRAGVMVQGNELLASFSDKVKMLPVHFLAFMPATLKLRDFISESECLNDNTKKHVCVGTEKNPGHQIHAQTEY